MSTQHGSTGRVVYAFGITLIALSIVAPVGCGKPTIAQPQALHYQPRKPVDTSGNSVVLANARRWQPDASLQEIADLWRHSGTYSLQKLDQFVAEIQQKPDVEIPNLLLRASLHNWEGETKQAYAVLEMARALSQSDVKLTQAWHATILYFQGVTALRLGENDNCIECRGASSCIFPIAATAIHKNQHGSRLAIQHFTEYLQLFPDDLEVRWLLNLAYMTLGETPDDPLLRLDLTRFLSSECDIGKFNDIGHLVGINRLNQAGGAILEDFDNDGLLDFFISTFDPTERVALYRNKGDGTFEDRTEAAGIANQLGGTNCSQADYNNDGHMDLFIVRGAWLQFPTRPTLLRNNGNGTFTDVTQEAGLLDPVNSICASWADFDNDGFVDLFICNETGLNRLYRNKGDGTFEEVAAKAGVQGQRGAHCKGCAWIDYDNDGYPDLFIDNLKGSAQLFHNNRDGTFTDVTRALGIDGPQAGFSCWAWDFDNDGYLDIFATSYDRSTADIVGDMLGQPHSYRANRLYRNLAGKGFKDVTKEVGLDLAFATMGSNFGDFDNDGYLDMYLGTGNPDLSTLVPNRMFKNLAGKRFTEITASSGTGHLQKGHGVACGDWDRDGNVDIFVELGGAVDGDKYHNVLFQNPGHENNWLTVKLVGKKTNRAAIGARIKAVTAGPQPLTVHRHISSGSSFGGNPLQQTLGLGKTPRVALLEITWPSSGTTQVFRDVGVNQAIEITEFATEYRKLDWKPLPRVK